MQTFQFLKLEGNEILFLLCLCRLLAHPAEFAFALVPLLVCGAVVVEDFRCGGDAVEGVDDEGLASKEQVLVLRVYVDEVLAYLSQEVEGGE